MNPEPYKNRELDEKFGYISEKLLLFVVDPMTRRAKTNPIGQLAFIFSTLVGPMHSMSFSFLSTMFASIRFTQLTSNPSVKAVISNFCAFPKIVTLASVSMLLAICHTAPDKFGTDSTSRWTSLPSMVSRASETWLAFIVRRLTQLGNKITLWATIFSSPFFQTGWLYEEMFSTDSARNFYATKNRHSLIIAYIS
jgi:hypothetical protein